MLTFNEANPCIYKILKQYAHENRMHMTDAEYVLWQNIRHGYFGHKFLRQYVIGDYIVDFICRDEGLIIEVDGAYHSEPRQEQDDELRQRWLERQGYHVLRFSNEEILYDIENTLDAIRSYFD